MVWRRPGSPSHPGPGNSPATVRLTLQNMPGIPTGVLLVEDTVPYALGTRPRFVLVTCGRGSRREVSYGVRSELRGRYTLGPLTVQLTIRSAWSSRPGVQRDRHLDRHAPPWSGYPPCVSSASGAAAARASRDLSPAPARRTRRSGPTGTATTCAGSLARHRPSPRAHGPPRGAAVAEPGDASLDTRTTGHAGHPPTPRWSGVSPQPRRSACTWPTAATPSGCSPTREARSARPGMIPRRSSRREVAPRRTRGREVLP